MSTLVLVRHAQTRPFDEDGYTHLTDVGVQQAQALGAWWDARGFVPDAVFVGPLVRHVETHAQVARAGWPDPVTHAGLDEHQGVQVVAAAVAAGEVPGVVDAQGRFDLKTFRRALPFVFERWAAGELESPGGESWAAFRARVATTLASLLDADGKGRTLVAFTSGGVVGAATGTLLGVPAENTVVELATAVRNTSRTTVRFSGDRRSLLAFNEVDHLDGVAPVTAL